MKTSLTITILLACVISLYSQCQIYYQYDVYGNMKKRLYSCPFIVVNDDHHIHEAAKNVAEVEEIEDEKSLSDMEGSLRIFPNPAVDQLNIIIAGSLPTEVVILDASGRKVIQALRITDQMYLDVGMLTSGIYYIQAIYSDGRIPTRQSFIKI